MAFGSAIWRYICSISSSIYGVLYLLVIFILAVAQNIVAKPTPRDKSIKLTKAERKLVFDLRYYISLQGFDLESHSVFTQDGYELDMSRIVLPGQEGNEEKPRYPVLLVPGLMQSSSAYFTAGPDAIGLVLVRAGFDVWLGNNRGGFHPKHEKYYKWSSKMWNWSMSDLATADMPAMVAYVRLQTGAAKIALVAHSQGTTQSFMGLAREIHGGAPEMGRGLSSFSALAPAVFAGPLIDRWFLRMLRVGPHAYRALMGSRAFIALMGLMRQVLPLPFFTYTAYIVFNYMLGWDDKLWDRHYRNRNFIFTPVFVSAQLMFWWLGKDGFADRKCVFENQDSKWFDERFPPLEIYACGRDNLVLPDQLINRIFNFEPDVRDRFRINSLPGYSHLDVLWAQDAATKVAGPIIDFIWQHVENKEKYKQPVTLAEMQSNEL